jgi:peroxiredoxin Q/BCP
VLNLAVAKWAARYSFLINPAGIIVKAYPKVNVAKHSGEVLADLAQLQ